jgi:peptidoglycan hydrolase-like protein with peptidoglycan-binding domain
MRGGNRRESDRAQGGFALVAGPLIRNLRAEPVPVQDLCPVTLRRFAQHLCALVLFLAAPALLPPAAALAQDGQVWLQIEAQPTLAEAEDRARAYTALFPETQGYRLRSGWYGIMLGPYPADEGAFRLQTLLRDGLIPPDSFIAFARDFGPRYWPPEGATPVPLAPLAETAAAAPEPQPALSPDETRAEARDSEALLTREERQDLQTALQWFGFYEGAIDGAFGPGTRAAMSAWQTAQGMLEPTGILTSRQRTELMTAYRDALAAFGFAEVVEREAGITVTLPLGLVAFDHYEPPFVHFRARAESGPQIALISQPGDAAALAGLYEVLQTLDAVPLTGERSRDERRFTIRGTSDRFDTTIRAELTGGFIKGWMLISAPGNAERDAQIIRQIEASFATDSTRALDPGLAPLSDATRSGLLAGLEVRTPRFSRSGVFVSAEGAVLTALAAVEGCGRVTLDRTVEARIALTDPASGLALLQPLSPLAPRQLAEFQLAPERAGTEVMLAGYSYEDRLPAPVMTFGTLAELGGLNGEPGLKRLTIEALPGDVGGPVLDPTGAVIGLLLPAVPDGGRTLPPGVHFAAAADGIARLLAANGVAPAEARPGAALPPAELSARGMAMTALVSCWDD